MSKACEYCGNTFDGRGSYCCPKCEREHKQIVDEKRQEERVAEGWGDAFAKWYIGFSVIGFFIGGVGVNGGNWWAVVPPFITILAGHKGLKKSRAKGHAFAKLLYYTGLILGYLFFFAFLGQLAGCVEPSK
ncbi:MAG: hypothetical protein PHU80_12010 [Kiritimatiellae bacterium]|nr:hypothetical protein [Kiritimatiellia bacterium]